MGFLTHFVYYRKMHEVGLFRYVSFIEAGGGKGAMGGGSKAVIVRQCKSCYKFNLQESIHLLCLGNIHKVPLTAAEL